MADFSGPFKVVMEHEGEYSFDKEDRGGETYKGIARVIHPNWDGWPKIDAWKAAGKPANGLKGDTVLQKNIYDFYKLMYWDVISGDQIPSQAIAAEVFDIGVNMGYRIGGMFLQRGLNLLNREGRLFADLKVDGSIGPATISAMSKLSKDDVEITLVKLLNIMQGARYIEICEKNPTQEVFIRGWLTRVSIEKK